LPAIALGVIAMVCHLGLYGRPYKKFLAENVHAVSEQGLLTYLKNRFSPTNKATLDLAAKYILYLVGCFAIPSAAAFIAYGALDEMACIIKYGKPPADPLADYKTPNFMPQYAKSLIFGPAALIYAHETYAVESVSLFKLTHIWAPYHITQLNNALPQAYQYNLRKLATDSLIFGAMFSAKYGIDWYYIPDSVKPEQLGIGHTLMTSGIMATVSGFIMVCQYLHAQYKKNRELIRAIREGDAENRLAMAEQESIAAAKQGEIYSIWALAAILTLKLGFVAAIISSTELACEYAFLNQVHGEEQDRQNTAQILAALAGGVSAVLVQRVDATVAGLAKGAAAAVQQRLKHTGEWLQDSCVRTGTSISALRQSCSGFFSSFKRQNRYQPDLPAMDREPVLGSDSFKSYSRLPRLWCY
jgi:hypothetical protein